MKQGPNQKRHRGRSNGRRHQHGLSSNYESNGPEVKIKGSASQVQDRYQALARDAIASGDRIAAENYLQHAEHYQRIINAHLATMAANAAEGNGAARVNGGGRDQGDGGQRGEDGRQRNDDERPSGRSRGRGRGRGRGQNQGQSQAAEAAEPNAPQPEVAAEGGDQADAAEAPKTAESAVEDAPKPRAGKSEAGDSASA